MTGKSQALAQVAMRMGEATYERQQQADASPAPGAEAGGGGEGVDAECSEVDDSQKA